MNDPSKPSDRRLDDASLDALFAQAGDVQTPDGLMDRIVQDAADLRVEAPVSVTAGIWERVLDAVGGWPSLGGLATATVAGIYVGFADPTLLQTVGLQESDVAANVLLGDFAYFDDALGG